MKPILTSVLFLSGLSLFGQTKKVQNSERKMITESSVQQPDTLKTVSNSFLMSRSFKMTVPDTVIYEEKKSATGINEARSMDKNPK